MIAYLLKKTAWYYPRSFFAALGAIWLFVEPVLGLTGNTVDLSYGELILYAFLAGLVWLFIDGIWISGFYRTDINIKSSGFDTNINVKFGDLFEQDGWMAIAVNDFFDSQVDEEHISSKSLHGILLKKYWGGNIADWDAQVSKQLSSMMPEVVERNSGKKDKFPIGTTAAVYKDGVKFLCVVLTNTCTNTLQTSANSSELNKAIRGCLAKARSVCAGESLNIPLMGSGLARIGIKSNILVDLILTAVFEETKGGKITNEIRIILPWNKISEINLVTLKKNWS